MAGERRVARTLGTIALVVVGGAFLLAGVVTVLLSSFGIDLPEHDLGDALYDCDLERISDRLDAGDAAPFPSIAAARCGVLTLRLHRDARARRGPARRRRPPRRAAPCRR